MAILHSDLSVTGKIGDVTAYKNQGTTVLRSRRGKIPKQKFKKSPQYARTRELCAEWVGVTKAGSELRDSLRLKQVEEPYFTGVANSLCKVLQQQLPETASGRPVRFSAFPHLLQGLNVNRKLLFESVIRYPLEVTLDRTTLTATVDVPELVPGQNFNCPVRQPLYRILFILSSVSDIALLADQSDWKPVTHYKTSHFILETDWLSVKAIRSAFYGELSIRLPESVPMPDSLSLLLSASVEFGTTQVHGLPGLVKYNGCGKLLRVG